MIRFPVRYSINPTGCLQAGQTTPVRIGGVFTGKDQPTSVQLATKLTLHKNEGPERRLRAKTGTSHGQGFVIA